MKLTFSIALILCLGRGCNGAGCVQFGDSKNATFNLCCPVGGWSGTASLLQCICMTGGSSCHGNDWCCSMNCVNQHCMPENVGDACDILGKTCADGLICRNVTDPNLASFYGPYTGLCAVAPTTTITTTVTTSTTSSSPTTETKQTESTAAVQSTTSSHSETTTTTFDSSITDCVTLGGRCELNSPLLLPPYNTCRCCRSAKWVGFVGPGEQCVCRHSHFSCLDDQDCCSMKCVGDPGRGFCDIEKIGDLCDISATVGCISGSKCTESTNKDFVANIQKHNISFGVCRAQNTTTITTKSQTISSTSTVSMTLMQSTSTNVPIALVSYLNNQNRGYSIMDIYSPMPLTIGILDKLIGYTNYSSTLFPGYQNGKLDIGVSLYVENLRPLDYLHMEWEIFTLLTWMDERLKNTNGTEFGYVQLNSAKDRSKVWTPSIYFPQSAAYIPKVLEANQIIYVHSDGMVVLSSRVILTAPCQTNLRRYPRNDLHCTTYFSNMAQVGEHLNLIWLEPIMVKPLMAPYLLPVTISSNIKTTLVNIGDVSLLESVSFGKDFGDCSSARPCLSATVHCTKEVGNFVVDTVIPSLTTLIIGWVSLFIRKDVLTTRVRIAMCTLFVLQGIVAGFNGRSPDSTILSSAQVWLFGLQFQIVALLICLVISMKFNELNLARRMHSTDSANVEAKEIRVERPESSDTIDIYFGISLMAVHIFCWFLLY